MDKSITEDQLISLADKFGIDIKCLKAVLKVEAAGHGFDSATGNIKIQFEPHHFKKRTGVDIQNKVDVQSKEWEAYDEAKKINWEAALLSTSWGIGQIMGFNHKLAGYETVSDMVSEFKESEFNQIKGMLTFIVNSKLIQPLRDKNWAAFAKGYNGSGYKMFDYDTRLEEAYNSIKA